MQVIWITLSFAPFSAAQGQDSGVSAEVIIENGKAEITAITPRCKTSENSDEILVCADPDADTQYRQAEEFREKRTAIKGGVPDAPDVLGLPPCLAFCMTFKSDGVKKSVIPYTVGQLPDVDQEYLELARRAEAEERRRQAAQDEPD